MNRKMTTCKFCGAEIAASAKTCPHCGGKNKRPVYKKWWFWVLVVLVLVSLGQSCGRGGKKAETADKTAAEATPTVTPEAATPKPTKKPTAAPTPTVEPLPIREEMNGFDKETNQKVEYGGVIFQLPSYLQEVKDEENGDTNRLYTFSDEHNGYLLKFEMIDTTGAQFVSKRDAMQENIIKNISNGKLISSSDQNIGGMMSRIFDATGGKDENQYGQFLLLYNYENGKLICVTAAETLSAPKTFAADTKKIFYSAMKVPADSEESKAPAVESKAEVPQESTGGVTPEFKKTMDEYEAFFNEYTEFMKKYYNSGDAMSMLNDYLSMLTRYTETMDGLDKIDETKLSPADYAYYTEVMLRIDAKLLEAANAMQ